MALDSARLSVHPQEPLAFKETEGTGAKKLQPRGGWPAARAPLPAPFQPRADPAWRAVPALGGMARRGAPALRFAGQRAAAPAPQTPATVTRTPGSQRVRV